MPVIFEGEQSLLVQLHMPRTGGTKLRECLRTAGHEPFVRPGVSVHDGLEALSIPQSKMQRDVRVVATFRPRVTKWRSSMETYLRKHVGSWAEGAFVNSYPHAVDDAALGLWDPTPYFASLAECAFGTWFALYTRYFVARADTVIPTRQLPGTARPIGVDDVVRSDLSAVYQKRS